MIDISIEIHVSIRNIKISLFLSDIVYSKYINTIHPPSPLYTIYVLLYIKGVFNTICGVLRVILLEINPMITILIFLSTLDIFNDFKCVLSSSTEQLTLLTFGFVLNYLCTVSHVSTRYVHCFLYRYQWINYNFY